MKAAAALVLACLACGRELPVTYSVTGPRADEVHQAADIWSRAAGMPMFRADPSGPEVIIAIDHCPLRDGKAGTTWRREPLSAAGTRDGTIVICAERTSCLVTTAAHELGHRFLKGHAPPGTGLLMASDGIACGTEPSEVDVAAALDGEF